MKQANTIEAARAALPDLGEYSPPEIPAQDDRVHLRFVHYEAGARDGKFHKYKYLSVPTAVFQQMQSEGII